MICLFSKKIKNNLNTKQKMTLGFSKTWPSKMKQWGGTATLFQEKIIEGLLRHEAFEEEANWQKYLIGTDVSEYVVCSSKAKIHTIRRDEKNNWRAGNKIHFVTGQRTKDRNQFAPVVPCISTQAFRTEYSPLNPATPYVFIGLHNVPDKTIEQLAINDGFESAEQFFTWFQPGFKGKIIHWTDLKY